MSQSYSSLPCPNASPLPLLPPPPQIQVLFDFNKVVLLLEASLQCLYPKLVLLCSKSPSPALDVLAKFAETVCVYVCACV